MVGGISLLRTRTPFGQDTSIGVLLVGFLAFAVVVARQARDAWTRLGTGTMPAPSSI